MKERREEREMDCELCRAVSMKAYDCTEACAVPLPFS